ncbi:hypothetical protein Glaag_1667 [Glaciecola sp. 4H-3-7+YE-5]|nr:hypothetical protein Glaag_1667 [Glaciecola sp. 4H-3-7+YE-5]
MNSTQMWDAGKFQENVASLISRFNTLFLSDVASIISNPNGDRKVSLKAIIALNIPQIQTNLHNVLNEIEQELRDNAHFLLIQSGFSEIESQAYLSSNFPSGLIKANIINELNSTVGLLNELSVLAVSHLNVLESNSGFGGMLKGLFKGYSDPVDGISHMFGQGSMQIEVNSSLQGFNSAALLVGQSIDSVSNSLHEVVLEKWNSFGAIVENL